MQTKAPEMFVLNCTNTNFIILNENCTVVKSVKQWEWVRQKLSHHEASTSLNRIESLSLPTVLKV